MNSKPHLVPPLDPLYDHEPEEDDFVSPAPTIDPGDGLGLFRAMANLCKWGMQAFLVFAGLYLVIWPMVQIGMMTGNWNAVYFIGAVTVFVCVLLWMRKKF